MPSRRYRESLLAFLGDCFRCEACLPHLIQLATTDSQIFVRIGTASGLGDQDEVLAMETTLPDT
jgi:hypothetical protein